MSGAFKERVRFGQRIANYLELYHLYEKFYSEGNFNPKKIEVTKTFSNFALEFKTAREKVIDNAARLKRKKEKERAPRRIPNQNFEVSIFLET